MARRNTRRREFGVDPRLEFFASSFAISCLLARLGFGGDTCQENRNLRDICEGPDDTAEIRLFDARQNRPGPTVKRYWNRFRPRPGSATIWRHPFHQRERARSIGLRTPGTVATPELASKAHAVRGSIPQFFAIKIGNPTDDFRQQPGITETVDNNCCGRGLDWTNPAGRCESGC
jgi:hypothetical protein